jgi:hypothetical protein
MDMLNTDTQVEELEISMEQAKLIISKADNLINLTKNPDFINIITKGYFVNEASRLVLAKATPAMATESLQKDVDNAIIAIGYLQQYFNSIIGMGNMARKSLYESEQTREELLHERIQ